MAEASPSPSAPAHQPIPQSTQSKAHPPSQISPAAQRQLPVLDQQPGGLTARTVAAAEQM
eukprot:7623660-Karenia_brevis.AAC.1